MLFSGESHCGRVLASLRFDTYNGAKWLRMMETLSPFKHTTGYRGILQWTGEECGRDFGRFGGLISGRMGKVRQDGRLGEDFNSFCLRSRTVHLRWKSSRFHSQGVAASWANSRWHGLSKVVNKTGWRLSSQWGVQWLLRGWDGDVRSGTIGSCFALKWRHPKESGAKPVEWERGNIERLKVQWHMSLLETDCNSKP